MAQRCVPSGLIAMSLWSGLVVTVAVPSAAIVGEEMEMPLVAGTTWAVLGDAPESGSSYASIAPAVVLRSIAVPRNAGAPTYIGNWAATVSAFQLTPSNEP